MGAACNRIGTPTILANLAADGRFDPATDGREGLDAKTALYMPLHQHGRLHGVLQLLGRRGRAFDQEDAELIAYVGGQLAEFLHRAKLAPQRARA